MERPTERNGGCVSAERAMAKIMHGPQRIISEEIGICYRRFGAANPARFFLLLSGRGSPDPCRGGCIGEAIKGPARWVGPPYRGDRSERDQPAADIECRFSDCRDAASVWLLANFSAQRRHLSAMRSQVPLLCGSLANFDIR